MLLKIEYKSDSRKLWIGLEQAQRSDLPIRDLNYYAIKALLSMELSQISKMKGVEKVLEEQEYLEREFHHALEAQMAIYAHLFIVDNQDNAELIAKEIESKLKWHYETIKRLSTSSNELTEKTNVEFMKVLMIFPTKEKLEVENEINKPNEI